uniref:Uncharacterized protein n=1 Tax=Strigamia maritima TaxID=126957 RepID=T1IY02_STRMM
MKNKDDRVQISFTVISLNEDLLVGASSAHSKHSQLYSVIKFGLNVLSKGEFYRLLQLVRRVHRLLQPRFGGKDILVGLIARDKPIEMQMDASNLTYLWRVGPIGPEDPRILYKVF